MKRSAPLLIALLSAWLCTPALAHTGNPDSTNIWTGLGTTGWQDGAIPAFNGTDVLYLGNAVNSQVPIPDGAAVYGFLFGGGDAFRLVPAAGVPVTLSLSGGIVSLNNNTDSFALSSDVTLSLSGSPYFDAGSSTFYLPGPITGSVGMLTLTSSTGSGTFVFNGSCPGNSYAGNTAIYTPDTGTTSVALWNSKPFGTGDVTVVNSAAIIAHNRLNLPNPLTFATTGSNQVAVLSLKSWDSRLTFSGAVTLASNLLLETHGAQSNIPAAGDMGTYVTPGPGSRKAIVFSGGIGEAGGSHTLTVNGPAPVILTGASTYTGGTMVGTPDRNSGALVFGNFDAIPTTGNITVNTGGYAGIDAAALTGDYTFAGFLNRLTTVNGAVGIDSITGAPVTYAGNISFNSTIFGPTAELGTASRAITLTGTITPYGQNYQFGNGGGNLTVASSLTDLNDAVSGVVMDSHGGAPLRLFLTGFNSYSGSTTAVNSFIVFAGSDSLPSISQLTAGGQANYTGASYIGYTDTVIGVSPSLFLQHFNKSLTWGIIGFDSANASSPANITGTIDLTGFNDGVYLGTSTAAILAGQLSPSTVGNDSNAGNTLRFTAAKGGTLTLNSTLADTTSPLGVVYGSPSPDSSYSNGTIIINGTNTYTGGTTLNSAGALTLEAGSNAAFGDPGSGITVAPGSGIVGLQAGADGLLIPNDIFFAPALGFDPNGGTAATLAFTGTHDFMLTGAISGPGSINLIKGVSDTPLTVTLLGNNQKYSGPINIQNSTLVLGSNTAAGQGTLRFLDSNATVEISTAYTEQLTGDLGNTAPVLHGISGNAGKLIVPDGVNLTFDLTNAQGTDFGGTITGCDGAATNASLTITADAAAGSNTPILYLHGVNTYTGGTTITGQSGLGLGDAASAGTGTIHLQAGKGGLAINQGVVLTNALDFQTGALAGAGTFAPTSINGNTGGTFVFGANQMVYPGIPGSTAQAGALTLVGNVAFASGGTYIWTLQNAGASDGFSTLLIQGNLDVTAGTGAFDLRLQGVDLTSGSSFPTGFDPNNAYSWTILTATGSIADFDPAKFAIDTSGLDQGLITSDHFTLTIDPASQNILLNYSAVPEPSTWTLLVLGLGAAGLAAHRRRSRKS